MLTWGFAQGRWGQLEGPSLRTTPSEGGRALQGGRRELAGPLTLLPRTAGCPSHSQQIPALATPRWSQVPRRPGVGQKEHRGCRPCPPKSPSNRQGREGVASASLFCAPGPPPAHMPSKAQMPSRPQYPARPWPASKLSLAVLPPGACRPSNQAAFWVQIIKRFPLRDCGCSQPLPFPPTALPDWQSPRSPGPGWWSPRARPLPCSLPCPPPS